MTPTRTSELVENAKAWFVVITMLAVIGVTSLAVGFLIAAALGLQ